MKTLLATIGSLLAIIGTIAAGIYSLDGRYERSAEAQQQYRGFQQQLQGVQQLYLESERRALQKDLFDLQVAKQKQPLTQLEAQRLNQVQYELNAINQQLRQRAIR